MWSNVADCWKLLSKRGQENIDASNLPVFLKAAGSDFFSFDRSSIA